ncbi:MAG: DUF2905 domain-containing protein [Aquificae bacterium]|nr:DUF2905 domain-containing protein [Aquificota bacterium]
MESIGKTLILIGVWIILIGLLFIFFEKLPFGIGRLPGDIYIKRDNFVFYFPITTSILISVVLSLFFMLLSKLSR